MSKYFSIGVVLLLLICIWTWTNMSFIFIVNRTETVSVTSLCIFFSLLCNRLHTLFTHEL